jgi:hypothetical protein
MKNEKMLQKAYNRHEKRMTSMTVVQLKALLQERGFPKVGRKEELIARLEDADHASRKKRRAPKNSCVEVPLTLEETFERLEHIKCLWSLGK